MTQRTLTLCADDFGLSPGISSAVAELAREGRLSAVSCITNAAGWREAASLLQGLPPGVRIGLHFNLTEGRPLSPELSRLWPALPTLPRLIMLSHLRRLPQAAIRLEWQAQLDAFAQATGRAPQMVDGHQHVHHLPVLRHIVLDGIGALQPRPSVRNTGRVGGPGFALKRLAIGATGGWALRRRIRRLGIAHNAVLLGAYDFTDPDYGALMRRWLAALPAEGGLLFCHPGHAEAGDPIGAARAREWAYLGSNRFADDLAQAGVTLGQAWVKG